MKTATSYNTPVIAIEADIIPVTPDTQHEYTLTTALVAKGYGVSPTTLRRHLQGHADELLEGKHFFRVQIMNAGNRSELHWSKRGVVRLGFFIRSERAKQFRDAAEDLIMGHMGEASLPSPTLESSIRELAREIGGLKEVIAGFTGMPGYPPHPPQPTKTPLQALALEDQRREDAQALVEKVTEGRQGSFRIRFSELICFAARLRLEGFPKPALPRAFDAMTRSEHSRYGKLLKPMLVDRSFVTPTAIWTVRKAPSAHGSHYDFTVTNG